MLTRPKAASAETSTGSIRNEEGFGEMNEVMTLYGAISVLFCILAALLIFAAHQKSDGKATDNSAHWVTVRGQRHIRNATVREVWERNHPGKSWNNDQNNKRKVRLIALIPVVLLMPLFSALIAGESTWVWRITGEHGPVWVSYVVFFGMAAFFAECGLSYMNIDMEFFPQTRNSILVIAEFLNIVLGGLGLLYLLVFGLVCGFCGIRETVPDFGIFHFFGNTFLWVCSGAGALLILDGIICAVVALIQKPREKNKEYERKSAELEHEKMQEEAKNAIPKFVMALAKDPDFACPFCNKPFRVLKPGAVWFLGGILPVCEHCYVPPIMGKEGDDAIAVDYAKAEAMAQELRGKL